MRFDKLAAITGGTIYNTDNAARMFRGVGIDSRTVGRDQLFVAIRGERNDGHDYIDAAVRAGVSGIVVEYTWPGLHNIGGDVAVVAVENSHEAMLRLAASYRDKLSAIFAAITGSNGKTTTKELTYHLLQAVTSNVYRSPGNLNNLFGVPLALFGAPEDTEVAVLELGISTTTEMPKLAEIVRPDLVAITNVGPSHLEFLDSVEAVAKAKLELIRKADPKAQLIINGDDPVLMAEAGKLRGKFVTFALDAEADFSIDRIESQESGSRVLIEGHAFILPMPGRHQAANLLAAYAVTRTLGYSFDNIDTEAISLTTAPMRGQIVNHHGVTFVADCYNANPASVRAGLDAFFEMPDRSRRIVVLGDMLELGHEATKHHRAVGEYLAGRRFDLAVLVGPLSRTVYHVLGECGLSTDKLRYYADANSCAEDMRTVFRDGDLVYVKASRGIGLENVIDVFANTEEVD